MSDKITERIERNNKYYNEQQQQQQHQKIQQERERDKVNNIVSEKERLKSSFNKN